MNQIRKIGKPGPHTLPNPFTEKNWENANMLPLSKAELSSGWAQTRSRNERHREAISKPDARYVLYQSAGGIDSLSV